MQSGSTVAHLIKNDKQQTIPKENNTRSELNTYTFPRKYGDKWNVQFIQFNSAAHKINFSLWQTDVQTALTFEQHSSILCSYKLAQSRKDTACEIWVCCRQKYTYHISQPLQLRFHDRTQNNCLKLLDICMSLQLFHM